MNLAPSNYLSRKSNFTKQDYERVVAINQYVTSTIGGTSMDVENPLWLMQQRVDKLEKQLAELTLCVALHNTQSAENKVVKAETL